MYWASDWLKGLSILSTGENDTLKIGIEFNQKNLIAKPLNQTARDNFEKWFNGYFEKKDKGQTLEKLAEILNNKELFELLENKEEAYKQYIKMSEENFRNLPGMPPAKYPPKPNKDFNLLKDWYFDVLEIEKNKYYQTIITNSPEMLNTFEIQLIEKLAKGIKNNYFPESNTTIEKHAHLLTTEIEFNANKTFLKWLSERKTELERNKVYSVEEETKIQGIKNWSKKQRTYLLLKLGIDKLEGFSQLGQKKKYELIANILNCSPRKAMEYYNHCEKELSLEQTEDVKNYLNKIKEEKIK